MCDTFGMVANLSNNH